MIDVSEQELTQVLDSLAVRRIRDLLDARADAVVTIGDADGHLRWASTPGTRGLFGRSPEDFREHNRFDYVHPDDVERARRHHEAALEGQTTRYSLRVRTADDRWKQVSSVAWAVDAPWGRAVITITTAEEPLAWPHQEQGEDQGQR